MYLLAVLFAGRFGGERKYGGVWVGVRPHGVHAGAMYDDMQKVIQDLWSNRSCLLLVQSDHLGDG